MIFVMSAEPSVSDKKVVVDLIANFAWKVFKGENAEHCHSDL